MGNDGKTHLTGNKKRTKRGKIIKTKKGTCDKNSRSFETVPSSQYFSVRSVSRDKTDGRTDREPRFGSRYGEKSKIFFLLIITYNHLVRVKTYFLVFASLSLVSFVRCAAKKQKEIFCAINTNFSLTETGTLSSESFVVGSLSVFSFLNHYFLFGLSIKHSLKNRTKNDVLKHFFPF